MIATGEKTPNIDRKSTRLNSSHLVISYAVFCLKKKKKKKKQTTGTTYLRPPRADPRGPQRWSGRPCAPVPVVAWRRVADLCCVCFFFFNDTATTEIYTLSLHDALPIYVRTDLAVLFETHLYAGAVSG